MNDQDTLEPAEEFAFRLSQAAVRLDQARSSGNSKSVAMVDSLNENLEVWVAIRTLALRKNGGLSPEICDNLIKLSQFVAEKTFASVEGLSEPTIDALININLQISEGFLEGLKHS